MRLFRVVVPLLLAGVLPCVAQSPTPKQPAESAPLTLGIAGMEGSPCIATLAPKSPGVAALAKKKLCAETIQSQASVMKQLTEEKNSACYSIRDYDFETPKGAKFPMLKSYSTCVPAARFEARNVMVPGKR